VADPKPIYWLFLIYTHFLSLKNNLGTLYTCSGLFPFWHTTLAYYVRRFNNNQSPFEFNYSPIKYCLLPDVCKYNIYLRSQLCTYSDILFWITYLHRFRGKPAILVSFVFHYLPQFFGCLYNGNPFSHL